MRADTTTFSPIAAPMGTRQDTPVYLRLTSDELELLKAAIATEHSRVLSQIKSLHNIGSSQPAMDLCRRRSDIETMMDRLARTQQFAVEPGLAELPSGRRDAVLVAKAHRAA